MQEQTKSKISRRKKVRMIRAEINKIETKILEKLNEIKNWVFENAHKIWKLLNALTKNKRE